MENLEEKKTQKAKFTFRVEGNSGIPAYLNTLQLTHQNLWQISWCDLGVHVSSTFQYQKRRNGNVGGNWMPSQTDLTCRCKNRTTICRCLLIFYSRSRHCVIRHLPPTSLSQTTVYPWEFEIAGFNPFTPESDQCQNSPAASQEIWHHTVWRTWLFIAYSDEKWLYYKFSLPHLCIFSLKGWENVLFELRSERVKKFHLRAQSRNLAGSQPIHWNSVFSEFLPIDALDSSCQASHTARLDCEASPVGRRLEDTEH